MREIGIGGEGKIAFVTGGGSGIGRATAIAFARAGVTVCIADIDKAAAEETAHLASRDAAVFAFELDVASEDDVVATIAKIDGHFSRLDYAFNNAGIRGSVTEAHDTSLQDFKRVMDINLVGVFLCQREELKLMYRANAGTIVNMASTSSFVTTPGSIHYTATKHAVVGLTKSAAFEAAPRGVRVVAVAPGTIATPMNVAVAGGEEAMKQKYAGRIPLGRLGQPEEIAETVVWLCMDAPAFLLGNTMLIDGGQLIR